MCFLERVCIWLCYHSFLLSLVGQAAGLVAEADESDESSQPLTSSQQPMMSSQQGTFSSALPDCPFSPVEAPAAAEKESDGNSSDGSSSDSDSDFFNKSALQAEDNKDLSKTLFFFSSPWSLKPFVRISRTNFGRERAA